MSWGDCDWSWKPCRMGISRAVLQMQQHVTVNAVTGSYERSELNFTKTFKKSDFLGSKNFFHLIKKKIHGTKVFNVQQITKTIYLEWYFSGLKNVCYDLSNFALFFVQWPKKPAAQSCGLKNRLVDHGTFARPCGKSQCLSPLRWENKSYFGKGLGGSETTL